MAVLIIHQNILGVYLANVFPDNVRTCPNKKPSQCVINSLTMAEWRSTSHSEKNLESSHNLPPAAPRTRL